MIKFYIHKNQLYNFIVLKEPIQLIPEVMDSDHFAVYYDADDLIFTTYRSYTTVELKTFRKRFVNLWKKKKSK